jgi:type IX secretion system substrate protein
MRRYTLIFAIIVILLLVSSKASNAFEMDTTATGVVLLDIGHYNSDSVPDTLLGFTYEKAIPRPAYIFWGEAPVGYGGIHDSLRVKETKLEYPDWLRMGCSASLDDVDNDDINDIIFITWGELGDSTAGFRDTTSIYTLYGQFALDTLAQINLADIDYEQILPFKATTFIMGNEIQNGKLRDISFVPSYELIYPDAGLPRRPEDYEAPKVDPNVKIYPNPAVFYTNIEITKVIPGSYKIELISLEGILLNMQQIRAENSNDLISRLEIKNVATGSYIIKIARNGKVIGSYQLVVVH